MTIVLPKNITKKKKKQTKTKTNKKHTQRKEEKQTHNDAVELNFIAKISIQIATITEKKLCDHSICYRLNYALLTDFIGTINVSLTFISIRREVLGPSN